MGSPIKDKNTPFQGSVVRQLAKILKETDLTEIEYEVQGSRIRVVRQIIQNHVINAGSPLEYRPYTGAMASVPNGTIPREDSESSRASDAAGGSDVSRHPGVIKSPLVGTAYLAPAPDDPPYVQVGAEVKEGDILMIVEAMKVMNPIRAPKSGKVSQILVKNAEPVEYDHPLIIVEG